MKMNKSKEKIRTFCIVRIHAKEIKSDSLFSFSVLLYHLFLLFITYNNFVVDFSFLALFRNINWEAEEWKVQCSFTEKEEKQTNSSSSILTHILENFDVRVLFATVCSLRSSQRFYQKKDKGKFNSFYVLWTFVVI